MKKEFYEILADRQWLDDSKYFEDSKYFKVLAMGHIQHIANSTMLQGISKSGLNKIQGLRDKGYCVTVKVGGRFVGIENK